MTSVVDLWRAIDPEARLVSGDASRLTTPIRGIRRSRTAPPHLPETADAELLVVEATLVGGTPLLDQLLHALEEADLRPAAVLLADLPHRVELEPGAEPLPVLASARSVSDLVTLGAAYLEGEAAVLERTAVELRLAAAEAALADPTVAAAAGVVAARIRRGVAVAADGELRSLHPRPAGRALAARFAAAFHRLLADGARRETVRRTRDGLWLAEQPVRAGASVWLFDDLPFAQVDLVAVESLAITLRALLRRPPATPAVEVPAPGRAAIDPPAQDRPVGADPLMATMLAVARANGRVVRAARELGVHRNTVLYRLRNGRSLYGLDPRRPEDALRLLREHGDGRTGPSGGEPPGEPPVSGE